MYKYIFIYISIYLYICVCMCVGMCVHIYMQYLYIKYVINIYFSLALTYKASNILKLVLYILNVIKNFHRKQN